MLRKNSFRHGFAFAEEAGGFRLRKKGQNASRFDTAYALHRPMYKPAMPKV